MEKRKILIVDDEQDLCEILQYNLTATGYETVVAYSAEEVLEIVESSFSGKRPGGTSVKYQVSSCKPFDLILLDVMMPGMNGFELAQSLGRQVPIIFLTAKDTEDDKLQGFELGADDYISKPFSVRELMARIKAVLARTAEPNVPTPSFAGLEIDIERMTATADGEQLQLTKTELEILRLLLTNRGQVFSRQDILDRVWPKDVIVTERTVDVNMTRLRKKLGSYAAYIVNRQGFGYLFEEKNNQ